MQFSDKFEVEPEYLADYGAVNISLVCDIPLFVDPMLIFNSEKTEYKTLHENIIKYFHFLAKKALKPLGKAEIEAWFCFHEVHQNWLGYSLSGNKGSALAKGFGNFLYSHIGFVLENNSISNGCHAEKIMLLYDGSGRDKISDMTVNLIKGYLLEYTQKFALQYINKKHRKVFFVDRASFNYITESFVSKEYDLPYIINEKGKEEYVLLTPIDILREDEPSINRKDFIESVDRIRGSINNDVLKFHVEHYIAKAVLDYEEQQKMKGKKINDSQVHKIELRAFEELTKEYPELYDYYVRLREADTEEIQLECMIEVNNQLTKLIKNAKNLINSFLLNGYERNEALSARDEAVNRIIYFKHIIEDCDAYRNFYVKGKRVALEADLQRMFKLVWYGTTFKADFEVNNGRGPSDAIVSKGQKNQCIIEFKLASNAQLAHIFTQVQIYEKANCADGSLIAIFYFDEKEYIKSYNMVCSAGYKDAIDNSIFLIDCRNDNKPSASIA